MSVDLNTMVTHMIMTAGAHPISYAKILVQLGHEPMAPTVRRNALFRRELLYPGLFTYIKHIRSVDGTLGLYRGLMPRLLANITTSVTYVKVAAMIGLKHRTTESEDDEEDITVVTKRLCDDTMKEIVTKCAAIIVSQPFHVISVRMMAQFVGRETAYNTVRSSIVEIYTNEGISGFFSGLMPRIAADALVIIIANLLSHLANTYILNKKNELKELRQYSSPVMGFIASTLVYPVQLTSTVMAANAANLAIATPPLTPIYNGWIDCIKHLHNNHQSNRGSSMFFRKVVMHVYSASSVAPMPAPTF